MPRGFFVSIPMILALVAGSGCSPQPEDVLALIRRLHESGNFGDSIEPLQELLDRDPNQPEVNYLLGQALLAIGQTSSAVWSLSKAAESPDYEVQAGLLLTRALLRGRNQQDAITAVDRVLQIAPRNLAALDLRIEALVSADRYEEVLSDIERLLELDPENLRVLIPRALALLGLERIDEAGEALEAANRKLATTERDVSAAMRARLCITGGLFTFEKGDPESAESRYAQCLEEFPTEPLAVQEGARFYDRIGQRERATEIIRSAYDQFPNDFRAMLAGRMHALGEIDEKQRLLLEAAEEDFSPGAWFTLADHYVDRETYPAAIKAFERALERARNPPPMLVFAYADTLVQAGDYTRARQAVEKLDVPVLRDLIEGRVLLAQGDARGALQALESGIRFWPDNPTARLLAGQAAERVGDFERAIVHYRGSMRGGPGRTEAGALLAELYAAQGARRLALDIVRRYLRGRPRDPEAHLLAVRVAWRLGQHALRRDSLTRLSALPGQAPVAVAEEATMVAAESGPAAAVGFMERAPLDFTHPVAAPALRVLLEQLGALGAHEKAQARVAAAIEVHPKQPVFHALQARALRAAGAPPEQVREAFERALELDPEHAPALAGLAGLAAEGGERERALTLYDRAAKAAPEDPTPAYAAIQRLLAQGRSDEAQRRLVELLERHPRHAGAAVDLAQLLVRRGGDLDRALALAKRAALFGPGPDSYEVLGWVQLERGEHEAAVEALGRALGLQPEAAGARYRLGLALEAMGDEQGASEAYHAVLEAGPGLPEAQRAQARERLARLEALGAATTP